LTTNEFIAILYMFTKNKSKNKGDIKMNLITKPKHPSLLKLLNSVHQLIDLEKQLTVLNIDDIEKADKRVKSIIKDVTKKNSSFNLMI